MSQKTYDKEFKLNVVKLYLANKDTKSIKAIAEDLGVSRPSLGHWIKNYKAGGDKSFVGSGHVVNQELRDLKRELQLVNCKARARYLKKSSGHLFNSPKQRYEFMKNHSAYFCIDQMAKVLVS